MSIFAPQWFETWFDTPLYEELYASRDMKEAQTLASLIVKNYPPHLYTKTADIACGRGRHSINLARLGYEVSGYDLSVRAIEQAKSNASGLSLAKVPQFFIHDMRKPVPGTFKLTVNLFTSFGYFKDDHQNEEVLANICQSVGGEGALVIDFLNPGYVIQNLIPSETKALPGYNVGIQRKLANNAVKKEMIFTHTGTGQKQRFNEYVKLYPLEWFKTRLLRNQMNVKHVFGEYTGTEYHEHTSSRMIILAERNA
ncbi:MAG: class I SAM-dependent methyltransferase [Balneolales bacterium]|nr:class I SAM-dependent methyltransferase [Balneolales bacterium]